MNKLDTLIKQIKTQPETTEFQDVINVIGQFYSYTPVCFFNGVESDRILNKAGENEGSCKIFSFALMHQLDKTQTLHCFGQYYRKDVLLQPDNTDHANIRTFIKHGWENINFENTALEIKKMD
jgi:hypothetical protein